MDFFFLGNKKRMRNEYRILLCLRIAREKKPWKRVFGGFKVIKQHKINNNFMKLQSNWIIVVRSIVEDREQER